MTREELHIAFKIEMDKNSQNISFGGCPAFLPEEIDYWLNKAYLDVITSKFSGLNTTKTPFEGSVKRIADLESLVKTDTGISASLVEDTNKIVIDDLTNNTRMFFVQAILHWNNKSAVVNLITHQLIKKFIKTYDNTPWIELPMAVIEDNSLLIYIDPVDMSGTFTVDITYVKYPKLITELSEDEDISEVPNYVQNEIINKAVQLALEDIESKRFESKSQLNQLTD